MVVAVAVALGVFSSVRQAEQAAAALGATVPVLVSTRPIAAGAVLDASAARVVMLPPSLVPVGALGELSELGAGPRTRVELTEGEVLIAGRLTSDAASPIAASLPPGSAAIALPVDPTSTPLGAGDVVDVFAAVPSIDFEVGRVATGAAVISAGTERAVIAVHAADVRRTATAVLSGPVSVVVLAPSGAGDGDVVDDD